MFDTTTKRLGSFVFSRRQRGYKEDKTVGIFFESKQEKSTREYHEGKKAGRNSSALDKIVHNTVGSGSKDRDRGFERGVQNQKDQKSRRK